MPDTGSRQRGRDARTSGPSATSSASGLLRFMFAEAGDERSQIADLVDARRGAARARRRGRSRLARDVRLPDELGEPTHRRSRFDELCELIDASSLEHDGSTWARLRRRRDRRRVPAPARRRALPLRAPDPRRATRPTSSSTASTGRRPRSRSSTSTTSTTAPSASSSASWSSGCSRQKERSAARGRWSSSSSTSSTSTRRARAGARSRRCCSTSPSAAAASGVILIGAQQTASEVERRVVANAAIRVVGRLDPAEARARRVRLPDRRQRASAPRSSSRASMLLQQPQIPVPLQIRFPFPAWATRVERGRSPHAGAEDPFAGSSDEAPPHRRLARRQDAAPAISDSTSARVLSTRSSRSRGRGGRRRARLRRRLRALRAVGRGRADRLRGAHAVRGSWRPSCPPRR